MTMEDWDPGCHPLLDREKTCRPQYRWRQTEAGSAPAGARLFTSCSPRPSSSLRSLVFCAKSLFHSVSRTHVLSFSTYLEIVPPRF